MPGPLPGFYLSAFVSPRRAPPAPARLSLPPGRARATCDKQGPDSTGRSEAVFVFPGAAIEGEKGALRSILIHTGKGGGGGNALILVDLGQVPRHPGRSFCFAKCDQHCFPSGAAEARRGKNPNPWPAWARLLNVEGRKERNIPPAKRRRRRSQSRGGEAGGRPDLPEHPGGEGSPLLPPLAGAWQPSPPARRGGRREGGIGPSPRRLLSPRPPRCLWGPHCRCPDTCPGR